MIDVVDREAVDMFRRTTWYGKRNMDNQISVFECSLLTWKSNWVVIGIEGHELTTIPFHYPTWLHNLYSGFDMGRPEPKSARLEKQYRVLFDPVEVRCYEGIDAVKDDLGYEPSHSVEYPSYAAAKIPAGRISLSPLCLSFNVKQKEDLMWVPFTGSAGLDVGNAQVFFQNKDAHVSHQERSEREGFTKSRYQACVITKSVSTGIAVDPAKEYYRWTPSVSDNKSQWLKIS